MDFSPQQEVYRDAYSWLYIGGGVKKIPLH